MHTRININDSKVFVSSAECPTARRHNAIADITKFDFQPGTIEFSSGVERVVRPIRSQIVQCGFRVGASCRASVNEPICPYIPDPELIEDVDGSTAEEMENKLSAFNTWRRKWRVMCLESVEVGEGDSKWHYILTKKRKKFVYENFQIISKVLKPWQIYDTAVIQIGDFSKLKDRTIIYNREGRFGMTNIEALAVKKLCPVGYTVSYCVIDDLPIVVFTKP